MVLEAVLPTPPEFSLTIRDIGRLVTTHKLDVPAGP